MAGHVVKRFDKFPMTRELDDIRRGVGRLMEEKPDQAKKFIEMLGNTNLDSWRLAGKEDTDGRFAIYYVTIKGGRDFPTHSHEDVYAVVYIVEGKGDVILDGTRHPVVQGDVVHIPKQTVHEFVADGPLSYIAVTSPDFGVQHPDFIFT
jgi:quercetin dioxygenase-like cupin family protein